MKKLEGKELESMKVLAVRFTSWIVAVGRAIRSGSDGLPQAITAAEIFIDAINEFADEE